MKRVVLFVLGASLIVLCVAVAFSTDAAVDRGKEVYKVQKCAMCHSIAGVGNKMSPLDGCGTRLKADEIKKWIKTPAVMKADTTMIDYPKLSDKDLEDLTAYMLSLK